MCDLIRSMEEGRNKANNGNKKWKYENNLNSLMIYLFPYFSIKNLSYPPCGWAKKDLDIVVALILTHRQEK